MNDYLRKRSMMTLASISVASVLLINLIKIVVVYNIGIRLYLVLFVIALALEVIGYVKIDDKKLSQANIFWALSLIANVWQLPFIAIIVALNVIGRNKMSSNFIDTDK